MLREVGFVKVAGFKELFFSISDFCTKATNNELLPLAEFVTPSLTVLL